ncbi:hypothetical protein [Citricoccus sp.]|uniref:hypothetical protein n=1 Tax=Citricoccus sp. TaxID=1978372 RepID=UPI0026095BA1|nr:hypothetical protein [Citricoccus sp.]HRO31290.1 hypothetical protein [Citricoccus sp.]
MTPKKPAHTERKAMTFWSVFEAKHGLRQPEAGRRTRPPMADANGTPAEPLPTTTPED